MLEENKRAPGEKTRVWRKVEDGREHDRRQEERRTGEDRRAALMDFGSRYFLVQHKERCRNYTENNKAAIDFSKMALRGSFLLNGAAAICIMYAKAFYLHDALTWFAIGALAAAIASGMAYIARYLITLTWQEYLFKKKPTDEYPASVLVAGKEVPRRVITALHGLTIGVVVAAYISFFFGVVATYPHLKKQAELNQVQTGAAMQKLPPAHAMREGK
ncbi:MAG: hypothetical protein LBI88_00915 [Deltaproteobacteria bacterium]|jgi:hypothetical protein|nr:hypothetical protein [Deltaproteobacteria bacterium]